MSEKSNSEVPEEEEKDSPNKTVRNKINYFFSLPKKIAK